MKFKINITQKIIDESTCGSGYHCAFARAYSELVPVSVSHETIFFLAGKPDSLKRGFIINFVQTSSEQRVWIRNFDNGKENVLPTSFEVEIPDEVIEYWYGDAVKAAQHIANSEVLVPA